MRTFPIRDTAGRLFAFEVENAYVSPQRLARVLRRVEGVADVQVRRPFSSDAEVRARFAFHGRAGVVLEPFGDNSRYWIGPADPSASSFDATPLAAAFQAYDVSPLAQLAGDLLSLRVPFWRRA